MTAAITSTTPAPAPDSAAAIAALVGEHRAQKRGICIVGSNSKNFYGEPINGDTTLSTAALSGISAYEKGELYLTAAAGTPLAEIRRQCEANGQMLPFDPPQYSGGGTFGGAIAAGLAGPGKAYYGGVRDSVLGVTLINGYGEVLNFGGTVVKNVAGYDITRLTVGAMGTLGIIAAASVKVFPRPAAVSTVALELPPAAAAKTIGDFILRNLPITATFYCDGVLYLRLSAAYEIDWARKQIGGDALSETESKNFWTDIRDHRHPYFKKQKPLWRIALPRAVWDSLPPALANSAFEHNGDTCWHYADVAEDIHQLAAAHNGHARLFYRHGSTAPFVAPPPPPLATIQQNLKTAFDPDHILNPVARVSVANTASDGTD